MPTIWKYPLLIQDEQTLTVPYGSTGLHVAEQDGTLCIWVLVDPNEPPVARTVRIYGTGNPFDNDVNQYHVGSVQIGRFVWHVFWGWEPLE